MRYLFLLLTAPSLLLADVNIEEWFTLYDDPVFVTDFYGHSYIIKVIAHDPDCPCKKNKK